MSTEKERPMQSNQPGMPATESGEGEPIRVNGFEQVLAMLKAADPEFRESLLRRLAQRDKILVRNLRRNLEDSGL